MYYGYCAQKSNSSQIEGVFVLYTFKQENKSPTFATKMINISKGTIFTWIHNTHIEDKTIKNFRLVLFLTPLSPISNNKIVRMSMK